MVVVVPDFPGHAQVGSSGILIESWGHAKRVLLQSEMAAAITGHTSKTVAAETIDQIVLERKPCEPRLVAALGRAPG